MANLSNSQAAFDNGVFEAETIVSNVEVLWQTAPKNSDVRRQIGESELNAFYEMAFLSIFGHWENFIEDCATRMIAGQGSVAYKPILLHPPYARTLTDARTRLLDGQAYVLWYDAPRAANRIGRHVVDSPLETTIRSAEASIGHYAAIRHAIAHGSRDVKQAFDAASTVLTGTTYNSPGQLLRTQDHTDPLNPVRWLRKISSELRALSANAAQ